MTTLEKIEGVLSDDDIYDMLDEVQAKYNLDAKAQEERIQLLQVALDHIDVDIWCDAGGRQLLWQDEEHRFWSANSDKHLVAHHSENSKLNTEDWELVAEPTCPSRQGEPHPTERGFYRMNMGNYFVGYSRRVALITRLMAKEPWELRSAAPADRLQG